MALEKSTGKPTIIYEHMKQSSIKPDCPSILTGRGSLGCQDHVSPWIGPSKTPFGIESETYIIKPIHMPPFIPCEAAPRWLVCTISLNYHLLLPLVGTTTHTFQPNLRYIFSQFKSRCLLPYGCPKAANEVLRHKTNKSRKHHIKTFSKAHKIKTKQNPKLKPLVD